MAETVTVKNGTVHLMYTKEYEEKTRRFLSGRYGEDAAEIIWNKTHDKYMKSLEEYPDLGGKKGTHSLAVYGGLLVFCMYESLPDRPDITELQNYANDMFMGPFTKLGKLFNLNRMVDMRLINEVFRSTAKKDMRAYERYPDGFCTQYEPYDSENRISRYHFTKCPNAEYAKRHGLLHVLPLLCNCDFFGISEIHGKLVRMGTCGNSDICDYMVMGDKNPLADRYEEVRDEGGFIISRKK